MKINAFILSTLTLLNMSGCEQKAAQTATPSVVPQEQQALQAPVVKTNSIAVPDSTPQRAIEKTLPAQKTESIEQKQAPVAKESTEQSLAEVAKHGREVTNSQESKSRTRAQRAEEEMQKDLENFK
jgi:hypothetical protein